MKKTMFLAIAILLICLLLGKIYFADYQSSVENSSIKQECKINRSIIDKSNDDSNYNDPDGTCSDMGYKYHAHDIYNWNYDGQRRTYLWRSFPRLPIIDTRVTNDGCDLGVEFVLENWNPVPDGVDVWYNVQPAVSGVYNQGEWSWNPTTYEMNSKNGYKMSRDNGEGCMLYSRGLKCLDNVELHTEPYQETWLGYFLKDTQLVLDAFPQEVLEDAIAIYTMDWAISRTSTNAPWSGSPESCKINYMDCVVIKTVNESNNFTWETPVRSEEPEYRPVAEHFTFNDDIDYLPVYAVFAENDIPDEVAIYVNDECRGAQVVEDTLCQICAHILEEELGQDIEFAFWYEGRNREERKSDYLIENIDTGVYEPGSLVTGTPGIHYKVSFKDKQESNVPAAIELQCYPNPFNPELTISFNLEEQKEVKLDIFNIKGQKVKSLASETYRPENYNVIWKGDNEMGQKVSSGIYLIRLVIDGQLITSKAVLMK